MWISLKMLNRRDDLSKGYCSSQCLRSSAVFLKNTAERLRHRDSSFSDAFPEVRTKIPEKKIFTAKTPRHGDEIPLFRADFEIFSWRPPSQSTALGAAGRSWSMTRLVGRLFFLLPGFSAAPLASHLSTINFLTLTKLSAVIL